MEQYDQLRVTLRLVGDDERDDDDQQEEEEDNLSPEELYKINARLTEKQAAQKTAKEKGASSTSKPSHMIASQIMVTEARVDGVSNNSSKRSQTGGTCFAAGLVPKARKQR